MATLEKIRGNAVLLIGVIAFALVAFIVGDFLKNPRGGSNSGNTIAEVNGEKITWETYQNKVNELTEVYKVNAGKNALDQNTTEQIQQQVWDQLLRDYVLTPEYDAIGLSVSKEELSDRIIGNNTDPIIRQMFANPNTGQFDKSMVVNYSKAVIQDDVSARKTHWLFYERVIKESRLNTKYNNLIVKGLMVTPKEAELAIAGMNEKKSIEYFSKPFSSISDSLVTVSDKDIHTYYSARKDQYKQDESRSIEYITFPIVASQQDFKDVEEWIAESKTDLEGMNDVTAVRNYVKLNSDNSWTENYMTQDQLDERYKEFAFSNEVGSVYGSYLDNDTYKIAKLVSRTMRSDSVKASHILLQGKDANAANVLADSLLKAVTANPASFAQLAKDNSADAGSAAKGGDLGWFKEGMMVKEFNDACFEGNKGDIVKVVSQFGIHIIYITGKGAPVQKVQLAEVTRKVEPSTETYRKIYSEASAFLGQLGGKNDYDKFNEGIDANDKLAKRRASLGKNDKQVNNMAKARSVVQWAYKEKIGTISDIMEIDGYYVIAALTEISEEGYKPVTAVSSMIRSEVLKEKKAEMIMAEMAKYKAESQTLSSLAQKMNEPLRNANGIDFNSYSITGAGVEPALVGAVSVAKTDVVSEPVKGINGVYMFRVVSSTPEENVQNAEDLAKSKSDSYGYRVSYQAFNSLEDLADITDNRYNFY